MDVHDVTLVTKTSHPAIFAAFELISHDCGRQAGHTNYVVPLEFATHLEAIEATLMHLRRNADQDFETLCIGEATEVQAIVAQYKLTAVDYLLQRFFEEFC